MAWTTPRTWSIGELVTKAILDTHIRDNLLALWPFTATGQIAVSNSATGLTILDAGSNANKKLQSDGTNWVLRDDTEIVTIILNKDVSLITGNDAARWRTPFLLNNYHISYVAMSRKSGTGTLTVNLRNVRTGNNVLSTALTVDSGETDTLTAAVPAVINTANDDVLTGDQIAVDVTDAGTSTLLAIVQFGLQRY